jgi:menaquinol-cytochrome c reductase iron-sulfur subunit
MHSPSVPPTPPDDTPRRNLLTAMLATVIGGIVSLVPFGAGLAMFLDPVLKRRGKAGGAGDENGKPFIRIASLDSIPADGTPVQVPVMANLSDAWYREVNQPVGAVYLRRTELGLKCYNAICPHAGCFVAYASDRKVFQCPCHTSAFETCGRRIFPSPSPRDLDELAIDEAKLEKGEVWVQFENYYPGKEHKEAKA